MPLLYPSGAKSLHRLTPFQRLIKIARHTPSSSASVGTSSDVRSCAGFKPSEYEEVVEDPVSRSSRHETRAVDDGKLKADWVQ